MYIRCKYLGDGQPGNPFRSPFPNSSTYSVDPINETMIVWVPDEEGPPDNVPGGTVVKVPFDAGEIVTSINGPELTAWRVKILKDYPGVGPDWTPNVA